MRHQMRKRNFGRRPHQRKALMRGLADQLIEHERITTTLVKAKELRKVVEPLITLGKKGDLHSRRQAASVLYKKETVQKLFDGGIVERFKDRPGGYTRIYKGGIRRGDAAPMAIIELIPEGDKPAKKKAKKTTQAKAASAKPAKTEEKKTKSATSKTVEKKAGKTPAKDKTTDKE